jgi:predicted TIM-barrel fold metal-dependent hydrolase
LTPSARRSDIYKSELARVGAGPWETLPAWSVARQLELMDELGIDAVLMSIASPGAYFGDVEFTKRLVKTCNEVMAQMVADHPGKFGAMGFVSLPDVEAACRDVEYALDALKIDGINLQTHTGHRYLGHPDTNELGRTRHRGALSSSCIRGSGRLRRIYRSTRFLLVILSPTPPAPSPTCSTLMLANIPTSAGSCRTWAV